MSAQPLVVIVGPTASGKSDLAVELCRALDGEVVNGDSMQLYRGMDIGTAKLPVEDRGGVPHHLLDVLDLDQEASVAAYQREARAAIADVRTRDRLPVLVGGSSLYVRAVLDDLHFPGTDAAVRQRWEAELQALGPQALHAELARVAPDAAAVILPTNGRRIVRALEVTEITGVPFVATMPEHRSVVGPVVLIGLEVDRELLDARIDARVERMWADGLVNEVEGLLPQGLATAPTASRAIGYAQVLDLLAGRTDDAEAQASTKKGTRAFARRQQRLFGRDPRITWLDPTTTAPGDLWRRVVALVGAAP